MDGLPDTDLIDMEERALRALIVAPAPWTALLETRHGIGGCSFIQLGNDRSADNEMYIDVHLGAKRLTSPDPRLDTPSSTSLLARPRT